MPVSRAVCGSALTVDLVGSTTRGRRDEQIFISRVAFCGIHSVSLSVPLQLGGLYGHRHLFQVITGYTVCYDLSNRGFTGHNALCWKGIVSGYNGTVS